MSGKDYYNLILKEMNEKLNSRRLKGVRRLNQGTTMLFPKKFLHNKKEIMLKFDIHLKGTLAKDSLRYLSKIKI